MKPREDQKQHTPLNNVLFTYELLWVILILSYFMNGLGDANTVVFLRDAGATIIMIVCNHFYVGQRIFFRTTIPWRQQKILFILHLLLLLGIIYFLLHVHSNLGGAFLLAASTAIFEEYTFRGMIFGSLLAGTTKNQQGVLKDVIITAILFGLIHLINSFGGNMSITLLQVLQTTALGLVLSALYLRSGSMLLPITLHFLLNFMALLYHHTTTELNSAFLFQSLTLTASYLLFALLLLRKKQFSKFYLLARLSSTAPRSIG